MSEFLRDESAQLRAASLLEGASYLLLLAGLPLKYLFHEPLLVQVMGRVHGGLFLLLVLAIGRVFVSGKWPATRLVAIFAASLLPLGAFGFEWWLRRTVDVQHDPKS